MPIIDSALSGEQPSRPDPGSLWRDPTCRRLIWVERVDEEGVHVKVTNRHGRNWRRLRSPQRPEMFAAPGTDPIAAWLGRRYIPADRPGRSGVS